MYDKAVTLLELLIVSIIIGILVTISFPLFEKTKERGLDKEASTNLKLIQSAERIYGLELGAYLSCSGGGSIACLNDNLRLSLPAGNNRGWDYTVSVAGSAFTIQAQRYNSPASWQRTWSMDEGDEEVTSCSGSGCP